MNINDYTLSIITEQRRQDFMAEAANHRLVKLATADRTPSSAVSGATQEPVEHPDSEVCCQPCPLIRPGPNQATKINSPHSSVDRGLVRLGECWVDFLLATRNASIAGSRCGR
jgi:hypothetical protein